MQKIHGNTILEKVVDTIHMQILLEKYQSIFRSKSSYQGNCKSSGELTQITFFRGNKKLPTNLSRNTKLPKTNDGIVHESESIVHQSRKTQLNNVSNQINSICQRNTGVVKSTGTEFQMDGV